MEQRKEELPGIFGRKLGMTQVFREDGTCVPATIIEAGPCFVLALREQARHGYEGVQVGFGEKRMERLRKSESGYFAKIGKGGFEHVSEIRCDPALLGVSETGDELKVGKVFSNGMHVDISGTSIGKGFAGVVKRFHARGQPATRGTHESRRNIGSIGCRKFPGRVFKNKKMPGHMGARRVTIQNLEVLEVRAEENILLVKGGIPGARGGLVEIRRAVKLSDSTAQSGRL